MLHGSEPGDVERGENRIAFAAYERCHMACGRRGEREAEMAMAECMDDPAVSGIATENGK